MSTVTIDPPRWPGGPAICPVANLPAFPTEKAMKTFQASLCGDSLLSWQCTACGHWHYWAKPHAPSITTGRAYTIPQRIRDLVARTRIAPSIFSHYEEA